SFSSGLHDVPTDHTHFGPCVPKNRRVDRRSKIYNLCELDFIRRFRTPSCNSVHVWPFIVQSRRDFAVSFWLSKRI
ncbi:unnamed protein product, partial [Callosobruchus maculatus]